MKSPSISLAPFFSAFAREESGMTIPLLGVTFMVLIGLVGLAIDTARYQLVQSRLAFSLDAAGLAAGSTLNTTNLNTELTKYMTVNFPNGYMGAATPTISATVSSDNLTISLTASTSVPTTFMGLFGVKTLPIAANSQITRETSGLELVMALDITGSMNSNGKLSSLKTAATSLINILYGNRSTVDKLWVGLVPFSQAVNIGKTRTSWIDQTNFATLNWGPTSWGGCVDARDSSNGDITDTTPSAQKYKAYYAPSTDNRPYPYNSYYYTYTNRWVTQRDWYGNPTQYAWNIGTTLGPNAYCMSVLTPMTAAKATILSGINALVANGNTHINLGAVWAWNMLSPNWRGQWGGEMDTAGLPLDYGTEHMNKAMILLTDGENTMSQPIYTAYGYLSDGRLGTTNNTTTADAKLDSKLSTVCTAMKNKGIYIYTIALGDSSDINASTRALLKGCASSDNYYFESPTASQLQTVFNAIADSLSNLRVSQ